MPGLCQVSASYGSKFSSPTSSCLFCLTCGRFRFLAWLLRICRAFPLVAVQKLARLSLTCGEVVWVLEYVVHRLSDLHQHVALQQLCLLLHLECLGQVVLKELWLDRVNHLSESPLQGEELNLHCRGIGGCSLCSLHSWADTSRCKGLSRQASRCPWH